MSLFINTSSLHNHYSDCSTLDVSETIERDCLSVLHKLHDQVNGLQLVQVVVQPLARLFNPACLATLVSSQSNSVVSNSPNSSSSSSNNNNNNNYSTPPTPSAFSSTSSPSVNSGTLTSNLSYSSSSTTPNVSNTSVHSSVTATTTATASATRSHPSPGNNHEFHHDGTSSSHTSHSRSRSFASAFAGSGGGGGGGGGSGSNSGSSNVNLQQPTSTYMMSPDTAQALIARLDTDRDVNWLMEIIGYGLSMPFSLTGEQDSVKDCCTIYCEWLASALLPYNETNQDSKYQQLSKLVPVPIRKDPNRYARKMLSHLYNVFLPRQSLPTNQFGGSGCQRDQSDATLAAVSRQAVLCHRVLRTIENIVQNQTNLMDNQTWDHLLALLLTVNDKLLSAPTEPDDIGTQLHDRILGVLFELVLLASAKSIPSQSLWKTFHEMSLNWRHRPALVDHWRRITLLLTKRIVLISAISQGTMTTTATTTTTMTNKYESGVASNFSASCPESSTNFAVLPTNPSSAIDMAIASLSYENLSQTWYRFLTLIGSPVELSDPNIISRSEEFYHAACASDNVLDPRQHPCLNVLPQIFLNSMVGLRDFIESFRQFKLSTERPKCNSILHIFGDWLFAAALIGSDLSQEIVDRPDLNVASSPNSLSSSSTTTEVSGGFRAGGGHSTPVATSRRQHQPTTTTVSQRISSRHQNQSLLQRQPSEAQQPSPSDRITFDQQLSADSFESGQAEAMAILCKIFSSKVSTEDISQVYLSRFYLCLQHCLTFGGCQDVNGHRQHQQPAIKRHLLSSVLINATNLLQKDLDGINLLIPSFIKAIEFVFECSEKEIPIQAPPRQHNRSSGSARNHPNATSNNINNNELRRSCILTLMNLLAYPFHFQNLVIRNCLDELSPTTTFGSLRPRLLKLLFIALQTETDPTNMQILFGGLSLTIHDLATNSNKLFRNDCSRSRKRSGDSSAHSSLEAVAGNNNLQDDITSQSSFVFNSNDGFLIKSLHVTCHLLINVWKHDTQVSLAALELLTTIARVSTASGLSDAGYKRQPTSQNINNNNDRIEMRNEYKQTTKWICDYICNQCSRPPPAHSRDMHSTIVAAYQCLSVWFYNHPYLLNDKTCVYTLMEVIELGVSGQKSTSINLDQATGVATKTTISKSDKIMKPSSMRVREAAESLLNICMVRTMAKQSDGYDKVMIQPSYDTVLDEQTIAELYGGCQYKNSVSQHQDLELRRIESYKLFKYFSDEDSIIFGLFDSLNNNDTTTKDSVICLLRTPFGKHCWRMKFVHYTEKSREKIIANKTLGLIKRPFQQSTTPTSETRMFTFPGSGQNKSLYFNKTAKFFPETLENLPPNGMDQLVDTLDDYVKNRKMKDTRFKNDLDKLGKMFSHQVLAEQKVMSESSIRIKRLDCEEPQPLSDLETARIIVTQLGLKISLNSLSNGDKISPPFIADLKSLDHHPVRTCDTASIFYIRRNRTSPKEILESVRDRHNVSLSFFEWILELGQPIAVKNHCRWTGKVSTSWNNRPLLISATNTTVASGMISETSLSRNQMLTSDHGGAIFDGDRMTLYWSDRCQELAFLVPHKIERAHLPSRATLADQQSMASTSSSKLQECGDIMTNSQDHNSDVQSLCSVTSDASSQSNPRASSQHSSPRDASSTSASVKDQKDNVSLSRQSISTQRKKLTNSSSIIGCDTNIIICWLECSDDIADVPCDSLLSISETGYLLDEHGNQQQEQSNVQQQRLKSRDFAKYFISPLKNGLYRINLSTSFVRPWMALPLVDGMTVSKGILSSLIRESVLNLCRRRRLDADSYQPPHVKRRLKIQEICNSYKISSRYESTDFYNGLFKNGKVVQATGNVPANVAGAR